MMNEDLNLSYFAKQQHKKICKACQLANLSQIKYFVMEVDCDSLFFASVNKTDVLGWG